MKKLEQQGRERKRERVLISEAVHLPFGKAKIQKTLQGNQMPGSALGLEFPHRDPTSEAL